MYQEKGKLEAVENCIVHMDVTNLDLHQVTTLHAVIAFTRVGYYRCRLSSPLPLLLSCL